MGEPNTLSAASPFKTVKHNKVNRESSCVAAWFLRRAEENRIEPAGREALREIDQDFYARRRELFADSRLTRQEKTQTVSIMTFDRMKRRDAVLHDEPPHTPEVADMGSKEIFALYEKLQQKQGLRKKPAMGCSFSDGGVSETAGAQERLQRWNENTQRQLANQKQHQATLAANDLYTKRSRNEYVHYKDKATDKTLFVDTGKAICLRRNGVNLAAVSLALELAHGRFGSTLNIHGNATFKALVVEAAASKNLDVHFTDKAMNEQLAARKAELVVEQSPDKVEAASEAETEVAKSDVVHGVVLEQGTAPYQHQPDNAPSPFVVVQTEAGNRTLWGKGLAAALADSGVVVGDVVRLEDKGAEPVTIHETAEDGTTTERQSVRRTWEVEREQPEQDVATSQTETVQATPDQDDDEQELAL